ncbi:hypothetical protein KI387_018636, partial [Taxus chinensis]
YSRKHPHDCRGARKRTNIRVRSSSSTARRWRHPRRYRYQLKNPGCENVCKVF